MNKLNHRHASLIFKLATIISLSCLMICCASVPTNSHQGKNKSTVNDPYEKYNRGISKFNDQFDTYLAKPIAKLYYKIMPRPLYHGLNNAFNNLDYIPTIFNDLLQANFYQATSDSWHLLIDSTVGVGGLFNVAPKIGLTDNSETFSLTLAKWGWKDSNYFVLPFIGPNTVRGSVGFPVDLLTSAYNLMPDKTLSNTLFTISLINERSQLLQYQSVFNSISLDPYVFTRNAYLQNQAYQIKQNENKKFPYTATDTDQFIEDSRRLSE